MSFPVSRGVCSQFVSCSAYYPPVYSIYRPSVALVFCDLLNVMAVCLPVVFGLLFVLVFKHWTLTHNWHTRPMWRQ